MKTIGSLDNSYFEKKKTKSVISHPIQLEKIALDPASFKSPNFENEPI